MIFQGAETFPSFFWFLYMRILYFSACTEYEERQLCTLSFQRKCQFTVLFAHPSASSQVSILLNGNTAQPARGKLSGDSYGWMWPGGGSIGQLLQPQGWAALLRVEAQNPGVLDLSALLFLTWRQEGALLPGKWACPFFGCDGKYAKCPVLQLIKFNWRGACGDDLG